MSASSPSYRLEEILALNDEIISLSRVELPLDPHLGRMSRSLSGRQRQLTDDLAQRLAAGQSLDAAIAELGGGFPPMYQAVVTAGLRSGRLTAALEDIAATARRVQQLRIAYLTASVYPAIILILAGLFASTVGVEQLRLMREICLDSFVPESFFLVRAIDVARTILPLFMALIPLGLGMLLVIGVLQVWSSPLFLGDGFVAWALPGAQRVARNCQWAMVFDLMSMLIRHETPLPEAVRLATAATGSRRLTTSGKDWADRLEQGETASPPSELNPLSRWLLTARLEPTALANSLELSARRYYSRARRQSLWIRNQLPIYATLIVGGVTVVAYAVMLFLPWVGILRFVLAHPL